MAIILAYMYKRKYMYVWCKACVVESNTPGQHNASSPEFRQSLKTAAPEQYTINTLTKLTKCADKKNLSNQTPV